jgi:hypothetical protein
MQMLEDRTFDGTDCYHAATRAFINCRPSSR